jgi:hypothetical protein
VILAVVLAVDSAAADEGVVLELLACRCWPREAMARPRKLAERAF